MSCSPPGWCVRLRTGIGKIYVVGGFGGERELEIYDQAADRWSHEASFPRGVHHAAAVRGEGERAVRAACGADCGGAVG